MGWHYSTGSTTHTLWRYKRDTEHLQDNSNLTASRTSLGERPRCYWSSRFLTRAHKLSGLFNTFWSNLSSVSHCHSLWRESTAVCGWLDELIEAWMERSLLKTSLEHRTGRSDLSHPPHTTGRNSYMQPAWMPMVHCRHLGICAFALAKSLSHC